MKHNLSNMKLTESRKALDETLEEATSGPAHVLIVDDEPLLREYLAQAVSRLGHEATPAEGGEEALRQAALDPPDLVLLDIRMKGRDGLSLLPELRRLAPDAPVLMMTGHGSLESAIEAMRLGAFDYLTKPFAPEAIELAVARALSVGALQRENTSLRGRLSLQEALSSMVGRGRAIEELRSAIRMIAPSRSTVLIHGESGTGKELVARALYEGSPRASEPFVKINCAAVPAGLLESELFGHEKGAFTGAHGLVRGKFEQAQGGTLLLDEISEMDLALQPKLLRALQEREFYRVGGGTPLRVDVRLFATTNADLRQRVKDGTFREDLFYRLNVVPIRVPPLRERREDIAVLAQHFLARYAPENGRGDIHLGRAAMETLHRYDWPGNVRELMNAIERAVILCAGGELTPEHLFLEGSPSVDSGVAGISCAPGSPEFGRLTFERLGVQGETVDQIEKAWILHILHAEGENRTRAARRLGVSVRTIRNKLSLYARQARESASAGASDEQLAA